MKVFYYIIITICIIAFCDNSILAQERKLKKADEIFEAGEYFRAIQEYTAVLKKVENKSQKNEIYFKIGDCYFMIGDYKKARSNYKRTAKVDDYTIVSKIRLAEIEIQESNFEEAVLLYNEVLEIAKNDSIALKGIESCNLAIEWGLQPTRFKIEKAKQLNSKENDFCPSVDEKEGYDHIYFSSTRSEAKGKKTSGITGSKFSDLFITKFDRKQEWTDAVGIDSLNTIYDEGTPCIFDEGRKFYYTTCKAEKGKKIGCQIYEAQKVEGEWMNAVNLNIVSDSVSIGHPAVSPDGKTIYFSARMQGGFGGADIWYVENGSEGWTKPKNMGAAINSTGDELFPFMRADETFFYSSTKHPTMGGLDIFIANKNDKGRWESENMKPPFSSNGNDFGVYYYANEDKGYFTSDRKGSKGEDIYYFIKPPL
jgi:peptidoglycan-associated lipoprotein